MLSYDHLDGPLFLLLASRLPSYEGCLRRRLEADAQEHTPESRADMDRQTMTMQEALNMSRGEQEPAGIRDLQALNLDAQNPLFEYSTG